MNILVSNDDGVRAEGIRCLCAALVKKGHRVYLSAPASQMSGASHSLTTQRPITLREISYDKAEQALSVEGTPTDCVKLGIKYFQAKNVRFDMVLSGINHGSNLGTDTLYSGTVAAAVEGALCGLPAVAVSVNSSQPIHFETAADLACQVVENMRGETAGPMIVNINTPDLPAEELTGVRVARLGKRDYVEGIMPQEAQEGYVEYSYKSTPVVYDSHNHDIDVIADQDKYATVTPLGYDLTDHDKIEGMKEWRIKI